MAETPPIPISDPDQDQFNALMQSVRGEIDEVSETEEMGQTHHGPLDEGKPSTPDSEDDIE